MPGQAHQLWKYQLVENFDVYLHKKSTSCLTFFLRYCNILQICHFGYSGYKWPCPSKLIISTCLKVWCLSSKKSTSFILSWVRFVHFWAAFPQNSIPTSFLKNLIKYQIKKKTKEQIRSNTSFRRKHGWTSIIAKILQTCYFGYFGHDLLWPPRAISACRKLWRLSSCKKNQITQHFLEILLRYCQFILGTLGMPGHIYQKQ